MLDALDDDLLELLCKFLVGVCSGSPHGSLRPFSTVGRLLATQRRFHVLAEELWRATAKAFLRPIESLIVQGVVLQLTDLKRISGALNHASRGAVDWLSFDGCATMHNRVLRTNDIGEPQEKRYRFELLHPRQVEETRPFWTLLRWHGPPHAEGLSLSFPHAEVIHTRRYYAANGLYLLVGNNAYLFQLVLGGLCIRLVMVWNPARAQPSYVDYTAEGGPTYAAWGVLRDPVFAPPEEANRMDLLKPFCAVDRREDFGLIRSSVLPKAAGRDSDSGCTPITVWVMLFSGLRTSRRRLLWRLRGLSITQPVTHMPECNTLGQGVSVPVRSN